MKKIVLTMVALMAVTFSFAETKGADVDKRFDMTCNMHRLAVADGGRRGNLQQLQQRDAVVSLSEGSCAAVSGSSSFQERCSPDEACTEREAV